jgi:O-antigen/teichoic acid export membrane protein
MSLKKRVAKNTIIQIVGKMVSTILGVLSLAILARYLGTSGFGQYSTIIAFASFFALSADLGLTLVTAQMISNPNENREKAMNNLFSLRFFSAIILLSLAPLTAIFFPYSDSIKMGILIATLIYLFPALNQILTAFFQRKLEMGKVMTAEIFSKLTLIILFFLIAKLDKGLNYVLWASVLSSFCGFLTLWLYSKKSIKIKFEFDFSFWKKILKITWPLALTSFLNLLYLKGDILILSLLKSNDEVGIYGAAYRSIEVIGTIPYMFAGIMLPILTSSWLGNNRDAFKRILQKSIDFMIIIAIPLAIGAQFVSRRLIEIIAGNDFSGGGIALQILMISTSLLFVSCIFSHAIIAIEKQRKIISLYVVTAILSLILYIPLIEYFSYIGASIVTIFSNILILFGTYHIIKKYTFFKIRLKSLKASLLSAAGMAVFMFFIPKSIYDNNIGLFAIILIASLIYFFLLYILKGISKDDIKTFLPDKKI